MGYSHYVSQYSALDDYVFLAPGVTIPNDLYPGKERSSGRTTLGRVVEAVQEEI